MSEDIDGCLDLANKNIKYLFEMQQERLTNTHRQAYGFSPKIYKLEKKIRETNKSLEQCYKRAVEAESIINEYETYFYHNHGKDIDLKSEAKKEKEEYFKRRRKDWEKN